MSGILRKWRPDDAEALAEILSDRRILDNLRDGIPFPYAKEDGEKFIAAMLSADENEVFAFAISEAGKAGFRCEGILRAAAVKNGKIRDMKMYSRLKED